MATWKRNAAQNKRLILARRHSSCTRFAKFIYSLPLYQWNLQTSLQDIVLTSAKGVGGEVHVHVELQSILHLVVKVTVSCCNAMKAI